jgi:hypothetical protein
MSEGVPHNRYWWLVPVLGAMLLIGVAVTAGIVNPTAREVLAKATFNIIGALGTPFILEATFAILGLFALLVYNHYKLQKEGDGWVYLAQTTPDAASLAEGAETPPHRLDPVVLPQRPELGGELETRLATVEGYLELGLKQEALAQLENLTDEERQLPSVKALLAAAQAA